MGFTNRPPHHPDPRCEFLKTDEGCFWCCAICDTSRHVCPGCGDHLTHLGREVRQDEKEPKPHECFTLVSP